MSPHASVVVVARSGGSRLRWLLNALQEQTELHRAEILLGYRAGDQDAGALLRSHPLGVNGRARGIAAPGDAGPGALRNAAWAAARAELVIFVDDRMLPPPGWLASALAAHTLRPDAVLQGSSRPDPLESATLLAAPWPRTLDEPPGDPWHSASNTAYPVALLRRLGGLPEAVGDFDGPVLAALARVRGHEVLSVHGMAVACAVEERPLPTSATELRALQMMPAAVRLAPELRRALTLGLFARREHAVASAALAAAAAMGMASGRARGWAAVPALPCLAAALTRRGLSPRGVTRAALEAPALGFRTLAEMAALATGSVRAGAVIL